LIRPDEQIENLDMDHTWEEIISYIEWLEKEIDLLNQQIKDQHG